MLAQILRERPLLRLLRGLETPEKFRALGRPSDPNVISIGPGWERERRKVMGRDYGSDIVSLDEFGVERPVKSLQEIMVAWS